MRRIAFAMMFAASRQAGAQTPDMQTVLQHVRLAYANLTSYQMQLSLEFAQSSADSLMTLKTPLTVAWERGGSFRAEAKGPTGTTIVSDGRTIWNYNPLLKQYTKSAAGQTMHEAFAAVTGGAPLFPDSPGRIVRSSLLAPDEDIVFGGTPHPCYVMDVRYTSEAPASEAWAHAAKFWVDKNSYLILKRAVDWHADSGDIKSSMTLVSHDLNQRLPAAVFSFDPPAGATLAGPGVSAGPKTPSASVADGRALVGQVAPGFKLRDLDGQEWQLATLHGKIVLLEFWATWCGPCRAEMPVIEKIHRKEKDVVVLGVDVGEDPEVVRKFIAERKLTYPILLGEQDPMIRNYRARALPSVAILDRNGVIRTYKSGYGSSVGSDLRAALDDARRVPVKSNQE